ncbi:MAG: NADH-quinone oxidoreductase subunit NuoK [Vampirovibrionia bacterium]|jgi:NAD(P)H-quinone oxidoreductase subunit 4L|nr:NADH-quinone oxidoreductase subunit NuoK [Cyanobacteria bacterium REEB446]NBV98550.1 NADH-quinone oxidoreductase subunit NuoK [Pseudomonadota bacterium]
MTVTLVHYLTFSALLFSIGLFGLLISRNAFRVLMSIEIMLNAVNINFVAFAHFLDPLAVKGQAFSLFVMAIAAAEVAIGLSLLLLIYRNRMNIDMDSFATIKW